MTNEELIKQFFRGRYRGDEESYGFSINPLLKYKSCVDNFSLYSKTGQFPMAIKIPKDHFLIAALPEEAETWIRARHHNSGKTYRYQYNKHLESHNRLIIEIAKQLNIKFVVSPHTDRANFQKYMEEKINKILLTLAYDLRTGSYISVLRSTEVDFPRPIFSPASESESCFAVPKNYQKLMENINALLKGERILELPKNQIALVDTDEVQSLWVWLIKDNPNKEERELLRKTYILSHLLAPCQEEKKGGLIITMYAFSEHFNMPLEKLRANIKSPA